MGIGSENVRPRIGTVEFAYREYLHFMDGLVKRVVEKGETPEPGKREELIELAAEWGGIEPGELKRYIADRGRAALGGSGNTPEAGEGSQGLRDV